VDHVIDAFERSSTVDGPGMPSSSMRVLRNDVLGEE
jgi:hypothetical protein